jgi:NAD-dependent deacetylase
MGFSEPHTPYNVLNLLNLLNLQTMAGSKKHIVVLTGAGMSAESGLKTFRDSDGLWMGYNIEDVATPRAFAKDPALVLDFYNMRRRDVAAAQPNKGHLGLAELKNIMG